MLRIDSTHDDIAVVGFVDDDVTREECAEFDLLGQSLVCQRGIAGAENPILAELLAEFLLERRLDVDVTEDAEFLLERRTSMSQRTPNPSSSSAAIVVSTTSSNSPVAAVCIV